MAKRKTPADLTPAQCAAAVEVCACSNMRMAARSLTSYFDEALQPSGLRATQLVILLSIAANEGSSIAKLARDMAMDPSTLNRNLKPLTKNGLVRTQAAPDGRRRQLGLTARGRKSLRQATPLWQQAQSQLVDQLGTDVFSGLLSTLKKVLKFTDRQ